MNNHIFMTNNITKQDIDNFKKLGYKYFVKAKDKFLSGWGVAEHKTHMQIVICKTMEDVNKMINYFDNDNYYNYVNFNYLDYKSIYRCIYNKSFTLRNRWLLAGVTNEN